MTSLNDIVDAILNYGKVEKTEIIPPFLVTVGNSENPLFASKNSLETQVFYLGVEVRSLGTASFIKIGTFGSVNAKLLSRGSYIEFDAPKNKFLDARTIMISSDSNDAILEVTGVYA